MPITHKSLIKRSINRSSVWIDDTENNSRYFQVSEMSDLLTAGKNAFLINGSVYLLHNSEVLVELLDVNGDVVFSHPIKRYVQGIARLISIEVYNDTPEGIGTLTILGRLRTDIEGTEPPPEFQNAYNVKWQRKIAIASNQGNSTPIRLYHYPSASAQEVLNPFRLTAQGIQTVTGSSGNVIDGISLQTAPQAGNPLGNTYVIGSSVNLFQKEMAGGEFRAVLSGFGPFTGTITTVDNSRMASLNAGPVSGGLFLPFETANYTMSFSGSPQYTASQFVRSFVQLRIKGLTTFSGAIYKMRVFANNNESPADPHFVGETNLDAPELMVTSSYVIGQPEIQIGQITDMVASQYWMAGPISSMSLYNPS